MKKIIIILLSTLFLSSFVYADEIVPSEQPIYEIAPDGFPTGQGSPEGVACDAMRAYMNADHELWLSILVPSDIYGSKKDPKGSKKVDEYEEFKKIMAKKMKQRAISKKFPKMKIIKVYKARNFSKSGPASLAYAVYGMGGNMFVDLVIDSGEKEPISARYHVVQDSSNKWYFEPRPDLAQALSTGLNKESKSAVEWERE